MPRRTPSGEHADRHPVAPHRRTSQRRRATRVALSLALLLLTSVSCSADSSLTAKANANVAGFWLGEGGGVHFRLWLAQDGTTLTMAPPSGISGTPSALLAISGQSGRVIGNVLGFEYLTSITGSVAGAAVNFSMTFPDGPPIEFSGTVVDSTLTGTVRSALLSSAPIALVRLRID
jgi:hypothetical protein